MAIVPAAGIFFTVLMTVTSVEASPSCGYGPHVYSLGSEMLTVYGYLRGLVNLTIASTGLPPGNIQWGIYKQDSEINATQIDILHRNGTFKSSSKSMKLDLLTRAFDGIRVVAQLALNGSAVDAHTREIIIKIGDAPTATIPLVQACSDSVSICANVTGIPIPTIVIHYIEGNSTMKPVDYSKWLCGTFRPTNTTNNMTFSLVASNCFGTSSVTVLIVRDGQSSTSSCFNTSCSLAARRESSVYCSIVHQDSSVNCTAKSITPCTAPTAYPSFTRSLTTVKVTSRPDASGSRHISSITKTTLPATPTQSFTTTDVTLSPGTSGDRHISSIRTTLPATTSSTKARTTSGRTSPSVTNSSFKLNASAASSSPLSGRPSTSAGYTTSLILNSTTNSQTSIVPSPTTKGSTSEALPFFVPVGAAVGGALLLIIAGFLRVAWNRKHKGKRANRKDQTDEKNYENWSETMFTVKPSEAAGIYDRPRTTACSNTADDAVDSGTSRNLPGGYAMPFHSQSQYDVIKSHSTSVPEIVGAGYDVPSGYDLPMGPNPTSESDVLSEYDLLGQDVAMTSETSATPVTPDVIQIYAQVKKSESPVKEESSSSKLQSKELFYAELKLETPTNGQMPVSHENVVYAELNEEQPKARDETCQQDSTE